MKNIFSLFVSGFFLLSSFNARANSGEDPVIFADISVGLTSYSNTSNEGTSFSPGFKVGTIINEHFIVAAGWSMESQYKYYSVGNYSIDDSFNTLIVDGAYFIPKEKFGFFIGLRSGYLMYKQSTISSGVTVPGSSNKAILGVVAGARFIIVAGFGVGLEASFASTLGKGTNIKRVDPRVSLTYQF